MPVPLINTPYRATNKDRREKHKSEAIKTTYTNKFITENGGTEVFIQSLYTCSCIAKTLFKVARVQEITYEHVI